MPSPSPARSSKHCADPHPHRAVPDRGRPRPARSGAERTVRRDVRRRFPDQHVPALRRADDVVGSGAAPARATAAGCDRDRRPAVRAAPRGQRVLLRGTCGTSSGAGRCRWCLDLHTHGLRPRPIRATPTRHPGAMSDHGGTAATVHWVGTGLSTGSGLHRLAASTTPVVLWGRTARSAAECARRLELPERVTTRGFTAAAPATALAPGDVVVSMLPAAEHAALLSVCLERRAHFACTSYTTAEIRALVEDPRAADLVVLTEAGLDPGIDHLLAHILVADARAELGDGPARVSLTSYCGGIPAVPDEFCHRFSWAPRGVLTALLPPPATSRPARCARPRVPGRPRGTISSTGRTSRSTPTRTAPASSSSTALPRDGRSTRSSAARCARPGGSRPGPSHGAAGVATGGPRGPPDPRRRPAAGPAPRHRERDRGQGLARRPGSRRHPAVPRRRRSRRGRACGGPSMTVLPLDTWFLADDAADGCGDGSSSRP